MISFPKEQSDGSSGLASHGVKVLGIGGAGCNVVDRMAMDGLDGFSMMTLNTDARALMHGVVADRLQMGAKLTRGLGAGGDPDLGKAAALECTDAIRQALANNKTLFLCVGLGGGTGSGAAPEVARLARESGCLVISFVSLPFSFEGKRRVSQAQESLERLRRHSDAVIVFENDRMGEMALATEGVQTAFEAADRLIGQSIHSVAAIIGKPGLIRIGLDDLMSVLKPSTGFCQFGFGAGEGENRANEALERALRSPLLNRGKLLDNASAVLVHISGGDDMRLFEVQTLMRELARHVDANAQIFFGMAIEPEMKQTLSVTLFSPQTDRQKSPAPAVVSSPPALELPITTQVETDPPEPEASTLSELDSTPDAIESAVTAPSQDSLSAESAEVSIETAEPETVQAVAHTLPSRSEGSLFPPIEPLELPIALAATPEPPPILPSPSESLTQDTDSVAPQTEVLPLVTNAAPSSTPVTPELVFDAPPTAPAAEPEIDSSPSTISPEAAAVFFSDPAPSAHSDALAEKTTDLPAPSQPAVPEFKPMASANTRITFAAQPVLSPKELEGLVAPTDGHGQRELQLGARQTGGRFDKVEPTVVDGEDLDLPAYLRKKRKPN